MNKLKFTTFTAALGLAMAFTLSCSSEGGGGGGNGTTIKKARITGVSQKGPFVKGSSAILYELNNDLSQTGRTFQDIIADDWGKFEIKNVELISPYALLKADGYYRNEVTGEKSASQITLYAITDVTEKDNVNINILTHLEYRRVYKLVEGGMSVKDAKKQAQREILAVFGISGDFANSEDMSIFGTSEGDAALLAISVLLQSDLKEADFSERLSDFSLGFAENGAWANDAAKTAMAEWASSADLDGIKNNILAWGLSSEVPGFGKYVYDYWTDNYGMGMCTDIRQGEVKRNESKNSSNADVNYACKNGNWRLATDIDIFCSESNVCLTFIDERDGKSYRAVQIGEQVWMADNLDYDAGSNECHYDDPETCDEYGRLYDWYAAMAACPSGWHIPTKEEWKILIPECSPSGSAPTCEPKGTTLKTFSSGGWWWSSSEGENEEAYSRYYTPGFPRHINQHYLPKSFLNNVRCLRN